MVVSDDSDSRLNDAETRRTVQSVHRATTILHLLARQDGGGTTGELARQLGVHKSTVSRLVGALEEAGLVQRDAASGRIYLGVAILTMTGSVLSRLEVLRVADPVLRRLAESSQETVNLGIRSGGEVVNVQQIPGRNIPRTFDWIGKTVALHRGALGKSILAYLEPEDGEAYLRDLGTGGSEVDVYRLQRELEETRRRGFALNRGDMNPSVWAVGAPIFDSTGRCCAALSVAGYRQALTDARLEELAQQVVETAATVSRQLGYFSDPFAVLA